MSKQSQRASLRPDVNEPPERVLICGPRTWRNPLAVKLVVIRLRQDWGNFVLIEGEAPGVDRYAGSWGDYFMMEVERYPADWKQGAYAGIKRNTEMLTKNVHHVVAIGYGRGTANCIHQARDDFQIPVTWFWPNQIFNAA